jgi:hypothetical protein
MSLGNGSEVTTRPWTSINDSGSRSCVRRGRTPTACDPPVIQVGSQELNVFSNPENVSPRKGNPVGIDHFCLIVDAASVEDVIADLRQAGIGIVHGPVERRDGTALFVHDPDGVRVELQLQKPARQSAVVAFAAGSSTH